MGRFLQLVLSCVVNGANKDEHIQRMMALDDVLQQVLMMAIQEIMVSEEMMTRKNCIFSYSVNIMVFKRTVTYALVQTTEKYDRRVYVTIILIIWIFLFS